MAKTKKERKRINVFDLVILLLLVCLVATFAYRIYAGIGSEKLGGNEIKYVMKFECEEYDSLLRYLKQGDAVYFRADGKLLGYLYAGENDENGAIYMISDSSDSVLNKAETAEQTEKVTAEADEMETGEYDNAFYTPATPVTVPEYCLVKLGGQIGLNSETVKVKSGSYYSIGDTNFAEGSTIEVYTDDTVFRITVVSITLAEE